MKNLKTLFNCGIDVVISGVQLNSKQVKKGDLFICRKGIIAMPMILLTRQ